MLSIYPACPACPVKYTLVWSETYLSGVGRNYRTGVKFLSSEILAHFTGTEGQFNRAAPNVTGNNQIYLPIEIQKMLKDAGRISIQLV